MCPELARFNPGAGARGVVLCDWQGLWVAAGHAGEGIVSEGTEASLLGSSKGSLPYGGSPGLQISNTPGTQTLRHSYYHRKPAITPPWPGTETPW